MSVSKLRSALTQSFVNAALVATSRVQQENLPFTPPKDGFWAALWFMPNQPSVATLGPNGTDDADGIFQIDFNFPLQSGTEEVEAKADSLRNVFPAGSYHTYNGETAVVRSCGRSPGRIVGNFFRISSTVFFYSHITR